MDCVHLPSPDPTCGKILGMLLLYLLVRLTDEMICTPFASFKVSDFGCQVYLISFLTSLTMVSHQWIGASVGLDQTISSNNNINIPSVFPQSEITGFAIAVVFFALMRQARQWELDLPIPSLLSAVESNLRMPLPFLCLALLPILFALALSCLISLPLPPAISFIIVSTICYLSANGVVIVLISASQLLLYVSAFLHVFIKKRSRTRERNCSSLFTAFLSSKVVRIIRFNPLFVMTLVSLTLVCFTHPALGLLLLVISHAVCCHNALSSHTQSKELIESGKGSRSGLEQLIPQYDGEINNQFPQKESNSKSLDSVKSYGDTQLEIFNHQHGLFVLHLLATLMFVPSLISWIQRMGIGQSLPWFLDSVLCIGVLLHGVCDSKPEFNFFVFPFPGIRRWEIKLSFAYLVAGYYSYFCGLALAPYRTFYPMATIGFISCAFRIIERRSREKGEMYHHRRKHSHKH
ncbi:glucose-6-phosphate 1-dehydrogenase family protein [Capsicum annuum]|nr:glucose-6-phosphate 1-dehydrogenase family protein [Capsicum annuum]